MSTDAALSLMFAAACAALFVLIAVGILRRL